MRFFVVIFLPAAVTCVAFGHLSVGNRVFDDDWELYKIKYQKKYESLPEEMKRRLIWEEKMAFIKKHNLEAARGKYSFTLGQGPFTDMTNEEFRSEKGCALNMPTNVNKTVYKPINVKDPPQSVNWVKKGVVTTVKNQGQCGSCWAFGSVAVVESRYAINTGNIYNLSEQQVLDCDKNENGCKGGWPDHAYSYMTNNGVETDDSYPYVQEQQQCRYDSNEVVATISGYYNLPSGDPAAMQQDIADNGPISVAINADSSYFQDYESGVIDDPDCKTSGTNHIVTIVGYDTTDDGIDYWLIKNSWGIEYGEEGYCKIIRNKDTCYIETYPTAARI